MLLGAGDVEPGVDVPDVPVEEGLGAKKFGVNVDVEPGRGVVVAADEG